MSHECYHDDCEKGTEETGRMEEQEQTENHEAQHAAITTAAAAKVVAGAWQRSQETAYTGPGQSFAVLAWALGEDLRWARHAMTVWLQQQGSAGQGSAVESQQQGSAGQGSAESSELSAREGHSDEPETDFVGMTEESPAQTRRRTWTDLERNPTTSPPGLTGVEQTTVTSVAAQMRESRQVREVIKPEEFLGAHEGFLDFYESMVNFMATWKMEHLVKAAVARETEITLPEQSQDIREVGVLLYQMMSGLCKGTAKTIVRSVPDCNGWEAIRRVYCYYVPDVGDRHISVLQGLLSPTQWRSVPLHRFWTMFLQWEHDVEQYEHDAQDSITSATRVAVVKKFAPRKLVAKLQLSDIGKDYVKCRDKLQQCLGSVIKYDASGVPCEDEEEEDSGSPASPMEVDCAEKGKGKKGKKGKKSRATSSAGQSQSTPYSCFRCGRSGHFASSCTEPWAPGESAVTCDFCEQFGHRQKQCPLWQKYKKMAMAQVKLKPKAPQQAALLASDECDYAYGYDDYTCEEMEEEDLLGLFTTGQITEKQYRELLPEVCGK
eukprot:TRINITY_DN8625_c0_g1_i1.p1 TRINITY_DN8625_c0_g1~~TRINITY_DN8625_c0_g1_i1.p1  ORF type:complete len:548 (+),score=108.98 TRINITY_DN8625_c0_g1_i1:38-1681(+)